jgi:hypothetical protein
MQDMAKATKGSFELDCPCCQATLKIDPETQAVITFTEKPKPKLFEDFGAAVEHQRGEKERRDSAFMKSVEQHKSHADVLSKKFDELLKQAKENPDAPPPKRDIDFD